MKKKYASVSEVSFVKPKYDYRKLREYCIENNLEIKKTNPEMPCLSRNLYPAKAWFDVYKVVI